MLTLFFFLSVFVFILYGVPLLVLILRGRGIPRTLLLWVATSIVYILWYVLHFFVKVM